MKRKKKIVLVSHCILNVNAKVNEIAYCEAGVTDFVTALMNAGFGIIQLPCLEMDMCGANRWGQVEAQLNHPHFEARCRELLTPILYQVKNYAQNGYQVAAVIGLNGSPTCGVDFTCTGDWSGEIGEGFHITEKAKTCRKKDAPGVMMRILSELLSDYHLDLPFYSLNEENPADSIKNIIPVL